MILKKKLEPKKIVFTEEVNKIALSANNYKRLKPIDLAEASAYGIIKRLVSKKEIKCNNIIKHNKND